MKKTFLVALMAAAVVAACGGSDYSTPPPPATSQVPASASQTIDGFISFLKELVASAADMLEPVDSSTLMAPSDETSEAQTVN